MKDPGCSSPMCRYRPHKAREGEFSVSPCVCDDCPACGKTWRPYDLIKHASWCLDPDWEPEHVEAMQQWYSQRGR